MKTAIKNLLQWSANLALATAVILAAAVWLPALFHMKAYVVRSSSMEPAITAGSVIYVSQYKEHEQILPGDIVSFQAGEVMVTHRIVSVDEKSELAVTKGDANQVCDSTPIDLKMIQGKVRFHIPGIGYLFFH